MMTERWTWREIYDSYQQDHGKRFALAYGALGTLALDLAIQEVIGHSSLTNPEVSWLRDKLDVAEQEKLTRWLSAATGKPYDRVVREGVHTDYIERVEAYRIGFEETYK